MFEDFFGAIFWRSKIRRKRSNTLNFTGFSGIGAFS